jgi:hypothetical protein
MCRVGGRNSSAVRWIYMSKSAIRLGVGALIAVAGVVPSQAISTAEPSGHQVRYTVTSTLDAGFDFYYLTTEPPNQDAVDADPNAFLKSERVSLAPGVPWVFETTLEDTQWAIITASSAFRHPPNPHCEIAVDGQVVVQQDGVSGVQCQLREW